MIAILIVAECTGVPPRRWYGRRMTDARPDLRPRDGVRAALPLALGPLLFGISFGLLAKGAGVGSVTAIAFSGTTFAGSAQFAAVSVLGAGGSIAAAVVAASLLNAGMRR